MSFLKEPRRAAWVLLSQTLPRSHRLAVVAVVSLVVLSGSAGAAAPPRLNNFRGVWKVAAFRIGERSLDKTKMGKIIATANTFRFEEDDEACPYHITGGTTPFQITLTEADGRVTRGIVDFPDLNTVLLCVAAGPLGEAPVSFTPKKREIFLRLIRVRPR
jgi:hypothetical protein